MRRVTLNAAQLKPFSKALTCLSKFGDDIAISANPEHIELSSVTSAKSAYANVRLLSDMFDKYDIPAVDTDDEALLGSLQTKALIAVIRPRATDKAVERCEFQFVTGEDEARAEDREQDTLEARLIIKLHCKHGVTKTHRIVLSTPQRMAPELDEQALNRVCIGAKAVKEILEHFPAARSSKSDPQLSWEFDFSEVRVRTRSAGADKVTDLSTELTIGSDMFDAYSVPDAPLAVAFPLREFTAATSLSEALSTPLEVALLGPGRPIELKINHKFTTVLCLVSTCVVNTGSGNVSSTQQSVLKRARDSQALPEPKQRAPTSGRSPGTATPPGRGPLAHSSRFSQRSQSLDDHSNFGGADDFDAAVDADVYQPAANNFGMRSFDPDRSNAPRSTPFFRTQPQAVSTPKNGQPGHVPLFLPDPEGSQSQIASLNFSPPPQPQPHYQMSQRDAEILRENGLGDMSADEVAGMMRELEDNALDDDVPVQGTQSTVSFEKEFRPLFED